MEHYHGPEIEHIAHLRLDRTVKIAKLIGGQIGRVKSLDTASANEFITRRTTR